MAPEVVRCEGDYGTTVGIYSAGERGKSKGGRGWKVGWVRQEQEGAMSNVEDSKESRQDAGKDYLSQV